MNPETVDRFLVLQPFFIVFFSSRIIDNHYEPGCEKRKALRGEIHKNTRSDAVSQQSRSFTSVYMWELRTRQFGLNFDCLVVFFLFFFLGGGGGGVDAWAAGGLCMVWISPGRRWPQDCQTIHGPTAGSI